jgi:hypothetical protein
MTLLVLIGIGGGAFVVTRSLIGWREWLRVPAPPSTHIAGEDDQDIDFDAAIQSIGGHR